MHTPLRFFLSSLLLLPCALHAATGAHLPDSTLYPRLIRLHHAPRPLRNSILAKTGNLLYRSLDEGRTFTPLASVPTALGSKERCCSTLYELPRRIGRFKPGTLLYAASYLSGATPAIEIYTSADQGEHWTFLSTPIQQGDEHHGLWEPEFTMTRHHDLAIFFSDETQPCCSQKLVQMRTRDLVSWSPRTDTVASGAPRDRPGMAMVALLPHHTFFMSYEICGPAAHCSVYTRTSRDGWNFGDPAFLGRRAVTSSGQYLAHAPASVYDARHHRILLVGQMLLESDGRVSPGNGRLIFTNSSAGAATAWQTIAAPVEIPSAYDNFCPNYSSAITPAQGGKTLLELASDFDDAHRCTSFFNLLPIH